MEHTPEPTTPKKILETLELSVAPPTTPQPSQDSSVNVKKRSDWLSKWLNLTITHPQIQILQAEVFRLASEYARRPTRGRTVVIFGENGCGKTRTAKSVARWASSIAVKLPLVDDDVGMRLARCEYDHWPSVVDGFHKKQFSRPDDLRDCELMILDDIGAEHDPSSFAKEQLYLLLTRREFRWNIFTTNFPPSSWEQKFERRIASRLFRNATHIDMSQVPDFSTT